MNNQASEEQQSKIKAISHLDTLVKLSGLAVFATAAFVYFGYQVTRSYFQSIGAPWALDLLTTNALILSALPLTGSFLFAIIAGLIWAKRCPKRSWIIGFTVICLAIAAVAILVVIFFEKARVVTVAGQTFFFAYALAISGASAEVAHDLNNGKGFSSSVISTVYYFSFFVIFLAPINYGQILARIDCDWTSSPLAVIPLQDAPNEQWRLVRVLADKALLVRLTPQEVDREFRIVATDKVRAHYTKFAFSK